MSQCEKGKRLRKKNRKNGNTSTVQLTVVVLNRIKLNRGSFPHLFPTNIFNVFLP